MKSEPESWQVRGKKYARSVLFWYAAFFVFVLGYAVTETLIRDLGAPSAELVVAVGAGFVALGGLGAAQPARISGPTSMGARASARLPMLAIGTGAVVVAAAGLAKALTH